MTPERRTVTLPPGWWERVTLTAAALQGIVRTNESNAIVSGTTEFSIDEAARLAVRYADAALRELKTSRTFEKAIGEK